MISQLRSILAPMPVKLAYVEIPSPEKPQNVQWRPLLLLMLINAFVGAMVGLERTLLPLIAERDFGLISRSTILTFLISFGIVKALTNLFAGVLADRLGRRTV